VAPLYPWALGSLFVASYDSQGSGGGIALRSHIGLKLFEDLDAGVEINSAWETIRENIKISAKRESKIL
jgi:hypothetical protein